MGSGLAVVAGGGGEESVTPGSQAGLGPGGANPAARPAHTDPDDADRLITILLAAIQRERARAEQFYLRSRNLVAFVTAAFTATQIAFFANLGRESSERTPLLSSGETEAIAISAGVAVLALIFAIGLLYAAADRQRKVRATSGNDLVKTWLEPGPELAGISVEQALVGKLAQEEEELRAANDGRGKASVALTIACSVVLAGVLAQMIGLYVGLK